MADTHPVVHAHDQATTRHYLMHYPAHPPREGDPHYRDFDEFRRRTKATAQCAFAVETGDTSECRGGLELHHTHVEFSLQQGVDLARLEHLYPGIGNPDEVGAWIETAANLVWLCAFHHRGHGGVHTAAAADYEASKWVRGLIT
ncbi:hypothetical protein [Kutzneria buriramensis]|uniref:Uncharacterized protein n=1 Tax=Kutzneria buriramensis TaxID=1045776 RepID=A0A3E0HEQ9_9PSEU|nr:hypothetical protein [Kutzneria buriramensis]REH43653.1 hypothetical protein BCF44_109196 [Kutzneria buriramensis]